MDKFTRIYLSVLGGIALIVLVAILYESPKVGVLNERLENQIELADYPYRFRVLEFDDGVATLSTPRAPNFSAFRALRLLFPALADEPDDSARLYDAQQELARLQTLAANVVTDDPDVNRIAWKLDERWLRDNDINPDLL